jgi:hypothetical protein
MSTSEVGRLLDQVAGRQRSVALADRFYFSMLALAALYMAALLCSRLLGVIPGDVFAYWTLLIIPAAAVIAALALTRSGDVALAARQVDTRMQTKDLFLTTALLDTAPGEYQSLVQHDALQKSRDIRPATVIPFDPWSKLSHLGVAVLILLAAVTFRFQLDPFGKEQGRQLAADRTERLKDQKKATGLRAKALEKKDLSAKNSERTAVTLAKLMKDLNLMKPNNQAGNLQKLQVQKAGIGKMWKAASQKQLANALKDRSTTQRLGSMASAKSKQWKKQMAAGNMAGMRQELSELQDLAKEVDKMPEGKAKEEKKKELDERLSELTDFASKQGMSPTLSDALSRAMQQLDMASMEGLSQEALEGLKDSLDLAMLEMDAAGQSLRDLQSLEEALKALQQAQALNDMEPLDGKDGAACKTIGDYAELYKKLTAQCAGGAGKGGEGGQGMGQGKGGGKGDGMGGPGQGKGGIAPEDPSLATSHKTEKVKSKLRAGKILLKWKSNELAPSGEVKRDYLAALSDLKHDLSEAIVQEEVPPGIHDIIKRYFDTIEQTVETTSAP